MCCLLFIISNIYCSGGVSLFRISCPKLFQVVDLRCPLVVVDMLLNAPKFHCILRASRNVAKCVLGLQNTSSIQPRTSSLKHPFRVNCNIDEIGCGSSATELLSSVAWAICPKSNENIVSCSASFPSTVYPWMRVINSVPIWPDSFQMSQGIGTWDP